jgi:cytochrome b6-f complex iron-sulfur subunit
MQRRTFLKQSCGACAAIGLGFIFGPALLESCASMGLSVLKTDAKEGKVSVPLADFTTDNFKLLRVNDYGYDIALQKQAGGTFTAMVLKCTHAGQPLTKAGSGYYCTLHGSKFAADGKVEKGPASEPMLHLKTTVVDNNIIITL